MDKMASESVVVMTELVLPNDTNTFGNLMGGRLMYWMDIASALAAMKHSGSPVVTASVDNISFKNPIKLGNVVHIKAMKPILHLSPLIQQVSPSRLTSSLQKLLVRKNYTKVH